MSEQRRSVKINVRTYVRTDICIYLNTYAYIHTYISWALGQSTFKMRRENERSTSPHPWGANVESRLWRPVSTNMYMRTQRWRQSAAAAAGNEQPKRMYERAIERLNERPAISGASGGQAACRRTGRRHACIQYYVQVNHLAKAVFSFEFCAVAGSSAANWSLVPFWLLSNVVMFSWTYARRGNNKSITHSRFIKQ